MKHQVSQDSFNRRCYNTWLHYIGFKQHFNSFDFKWGFDKTKLGNISPNSFFSRKDVQSFAAFVDLVPNFADRQQMMVSAFIMDSNTYVTNIYQPSDELHEFHNSRISVISSLKYFLKQDVANIEEYLYNNPSLKLTDMLKIGDSEHTPLIIKNADEIGVNLETLGIINNYFKFTRFESISPLWNRNRLRVDKYGQLLTCDREWFEPQLQKLIKIN